jgi:hypothetical protein
MVAYTTTYSFAKPTVGDDEDVWGGYLNGNFDTLESLLKGTTALTAINVTGNITVGGTVDGRDVAADGTKLDGIESGAEVNVATNLGNAHTANNVQITSSTGTNTVINAASTSFAGVMLPTDKSKLDGIESGATADQTKADIDALGINAATLDSLDSTQFLRSDTADTATKISFGTGNVQAPTTSDSSTGARLILYPNGSGRDYALGIESGTMWFNSDDHYKWYVDGSLKFEWDNTAGQLEVGGNKVWHAGNDGSGSGLDADTVDGIQASSFLRSDANDTMTGKLTLGNELRIDNGNSTATHLNYSDTGVNYIRGTSTIIDTPVTLNGTLTLGANIINDVEDIYLRDTIFHDGDTNTYIQFHAADQFRVVTGGTERLEVNNSRTQIDTLLTDAAIGEDYDALSGTSPTADPDNGGAFSLTMSGNTTFTFGAPALGSGVSTGFIIELTGNGSTVTWPSSVEWAGGTAPDAPASGETDIYVFWTRDGGTTWYGVQSIDAAA